jgi:hypothetical protein
VAAEARVPAARVADTRGKKEKEVDESAKVTDGLGVFRGDGGRKVSAPCAGVFAHCRPAAQAGWVARGLCPVILSDTGRLRA